jgi:ribosomal RNA-processing protein 8
MGVNFPDFLVEANRVLKSGGTLFIAEVLSRFTNVSEFVRHMKEECGFKALKVTKLKDFFYIMIF